METMVTLFPKRVSARNPIPTLAGDATKRTTHKPPTANMAVNMTFLDLCI